MKRKISLQNLILILISFAMLGTSIGGLASSIIVSKGHLEQSYLHENQFYAEKLADTTDSLFRNMFRTLEVGAKSVSLLMGNQETMALEINKIYDSTNFFNSVFFVDHNGVIVSTAPNYGLLGKQLQSVGVKEALTKKQSLISQPYIGVTGRLMVLISYPVFNDGGEYLGFIGSTIYLEEQNSIKETLGLHPEHMNDSYVYVVDSKGNIIYHPEKERIGENVIQNNVVKKVVKGEEGQAEVKNTKGIKMLAGFSYVETSKWGIVSQTPAQSVMGPTYELANNVAKYTIPFIIFIFIISFLLLKAIVNPLKQLANYARFIAERKNVSQPVIPDRYIELSELKTTMFKMVKAHKEQVDLAESQSILDSLTGLYNRRHFDKVMNKYKNYSVLILDIDYFKAVNDEFGHLKGDEVLKFLANLLKEEIRDLDLCFRLGGEEFLILLPDTEIEDAQQIAERIREKVESTPSPTGKVITISIGIGNMPKTAIHYTELFNLVDQALYKAKRNGRNQSAIAENNRRSHP
ncbi:sensor domain-containing diguanylate cyclase [Bacillus sp. AK128]